ncbi:MAG: PLP-dependent transferase [Gammaproteobacteria bacterium]|nr:PLP-dependent transferase [Gammaproteobacteria bacterium]
MSDNSHLKPETLLSHAGGIDPVNGAVVPALQASTTYTRDADYQLIGNSAAYTRMGNPTDKAASELLAKLEKGSEALLFASGTAAAAAIVQALRPGDRIVAPRIMYWGLRNWLEDFCAQWGMELALFDARVEGDMADVISRKPTALLWLETPCNPTWDIIDIRQAVAVARSAGALVAVDSTVNSPVLCQPLALGADIVFHSATKYLNGHSDVLAGAVITRENSAFWEKIKYNRVNTGSVLGPFESWLLARGMRTLHLRMQRASENAMALARHFEGHPKIKAVMYPGLASHPGHEIASQQMQGGFGGMLSIRVHGGPVAARGICAACKVFIPATSLGGTESLIEFRHLIEGPDSPVPDDLLRLSVGCENIDDLIDDLEQALDTI